MTIKTPFKLLFVAAFLGAAFGGGGAAQAEKIKLIVGFQEASLPETVEASKVLEGAPYDVQWVILPGPAAQLSALYSKAIDVGHMGDTSLIIEQGKSQLAWSEDNAPLQIVAGWANPDSKYPTISTTVRTSSGVNSLADLKGKKWAYNFGGYNYAQYRLSLLKAGFKESDIEPVKLVDQTATAAAFNSGRVDAVSGATAYVAEAIEKGDAKIIATNSDLEIPALSVFTARGDVVRDPAKSAALADFLGRIKNYWTWYAANLGTVEKIYVEKLKQTPNRARISAEFGNAKFQPLDDDLIRREQRIAGVLLDGGAIPKKIEVGVEFARKFNAVTVSPSN